MQSAEAGGDVEPRAQVNATPGAEGEAFPVGLADGLEWRVGSGEFALPPSRESD